MNESYQNFFPATILKYDAKTRTAKISIPTITDGIEDGITATFAYAVGENDKDTEIEIVEGCECYIFFLRGRVESPVIAFYRSHGMETAIDVRRIRQENIELLARNNININAEEELNLTAKTVRISAENFIVDADVEHLKKSNLVGETIIEGVGWLGHSHNGVQGGSGSSGGVRK